MEKGSIFLIVVVILLFLLAIKVFFMFTYTPFTMDENQNILSCQSCRCIGVLIIMESYPEQYDCKGLEFCKDADFSKCG